MHRIIGISDEVTTCGCCGKMNLKRTVVVSDENGEKYLGTSCAAKLMGRQTKDVNRQAERIANGWKPKRYDYSKPIFLNGIFQGYHTL